MVRGCRWLLIFLHAASADKKCRCDAPEIVDALAAVAPPAPLRLSVRGARPLSPQLVLIKIPETGSSTAAALLSELAAKRGIPCWQHGGALSFAAAVEKRPKGDPKWALAHRGWGPWVEAHFERKQRMVVTTARDPTKRLYSRGEKRVLRGEPVNCKEGADVAIRFWSADGKRGEGLKKTAEAAVAKFEDVWVMERYNESLVAFALTHGLPLGDVVPPLAKYHDRDAPRNATKPAPSRQSAYAKARWTCERDKVEATRAFALETRVHAAAGAALDARIAKLESSGVAWRDLVALFSRHLHVAMTLGAQIRDNSAVFGDDRQSSSTLLMSACARGCAMRALDAAAVLDYG